MDLGIQLKQGMKLEQNLSPQMLQSIKMLQMNTIELQTAISQELEVNPLLEADEPADSRMESLDEPVRESSGVDGDDNSYDLMEPGTENSIDWEQYMEDGFRNAEAPYKDLGGKDPDEDLRPEPTRGLSMQEVLKNQLREWKRPPQIVKIVEYLIGCIGDNGFLAPAEKDLLTDENSEEQSDPDIAEVEEVLQNKKKLEDASYPVQEAFHVLQSFTPPGIGARDLRECFLIQAYRIPDFSPLAIQILEKHFDALRELRYATIAKALNVSTEEVQKAVHDLSVLSPHPGTQINNVPTQAIVPDMEVVKDGKGNFKVVMYHEYIPHLHINETYRQILQQPNASKKDKEYVREKLNAANTFIKSIDNRHSTIELVMNAILEKQHDFFAKGPENLKPMILQDIADKINRDPSTVNRATNGKYVDTPYGIYELKQFFSSGVTQSDGTSIGSAKILDTIKDLVANEDRSAPLSDQAIADALENQGMKVARRTVAKYREELKILPARLRKAVK
ncbi:MAG: RNA polymerase factor sigma-54 [Fibrobacter sp.]|nr:RNA polymerase factor sigma-54 [Fibrobacter sp.]